MTSLVDQLSCVRRELALRRSAYPGFIRNGRMTREKAQHEIECMEAVEASIRKLLYLEQATTDLLNDTATTTPAAQR